MRRLIGHRFRKSTLWLVLFIGILSGLGLAHFYSYSYSIYLYLLIFLAVIFFKKRNLLLIVIIFLLGVCAGWWRGFAYSQCLAIYQDLYYKKVTLKVIAKEDAIYDKYKQIAFSAENVTLNDGKVLKGKLQVSGFGVNSVYQGDELLIAGKLFPGYGAFQGRISFAELELLQHHPSLLSEIRRKFIAGAQTALPEPLAPFVMGLLVGQRATLPEDVKQDLRVVGLTHIIAVSGYNLTIILNASRKALGNKSKRISTFLSVTLIGVFLILAGASASIVRAAMVSMLSIAAAYYGRSFKPLNLICLAAVITAWANPIYIWQDLSWYLSFLAFFGVMILAPLLHSRLPGKWHGTLIGGIALESICAEIMTLPFVLHIFGQMSRVGLIANVLVVSLIPLAMLLGAFSGLAGMLFGAISGWITWPTVILLNYMLDVARILANLPNVFVEDISLSLWQMLFLYGICAILIMTLWRKSDKSSIITDMSDPNKRSLMV